MCYFHMTYKCPRDKAECMAVEAITEFLVEREGLEVFLVLFGN